MVPSPVLARSLRLKRSPSWAMATAPRARPRPLMASRVPNPVGPSWLMAAARLMASTYKAASKLYKSTNCNIAERTLRRSRRTTRPSPISCQTVALRGWRGGSRRLMPASTMAARP